MHARQGQRRRDRPGDDSLRVVVVTCPMRATPTTIVVPGAAQDRSTQQGRLVADPVDTPGGEQLHAVVGAPGVPPGGRRRTRAVRRAACPTARWPGRAETDSGPGRRRSPARPGVSNVRTSPPIGAAGRRTARSWHGSTGPSSVTFSSVVLHRPATIGSDPAQLAGAEQLVLGAARPAPRSAWSTPGSVRRPPSPWSAGGGPRASWVTATPLTTSRAATAAAPTRVWVRRRALPARRMMRRAGASGRRRPDRASGSSTVRIIAESTLRWDANSAVARLQLALGDGQGQLRLAGEVLHRARW